MMASASWFLARVSPGGTNIRSTTQEHHTACVRLLLPLNLTRTDDDERDEYTQVHVVKQEDKPNGERLVVMKGAPERIIDRCSEVLLGSRVVPMTPELKAEIEAHQETLSRNGLRVLG